jgi:prepilin peptidase CpaA
VNIVEKYLLICASGIAIAGAVQDVRGGRIPNWLTYPGLIAALAVRCAVSGWPGLKSGLAGLLVAGGIFYLLFLLGGMGGGDVKLMAAVGAWAGDVQAVAVLIAAAIAGGTLAVFYMVSRKQVWRTLLNTGELLRHHVTSGLRPHPVLNVREPSTMRVPYGLAIAMGTLYCVGNAFWWR